MKWFYVMSLAVVALLALLPLTYLRGEREERYAGKVVRYGSYGAEVKSLDPATCGDTTSAGIQGDFYEGLYTYHWLKRPLEVVPQLAEGMPEISPDGLTYTIKLKPGVKYSRNPCFGPDPSGQHQCATRTVRADDFVLAYKRVADYHINTGLAWAFLSERVAGLDEWRERTQGIPDRFKDVLSEFDQWRQAASGPAELPATLRANLQRLFQWSRQLHLHDDAKRALGDVAAWVDKAEDGKAEVSEIATALKTLDAWRAAMKGYKAGDFSRYDLPVEGVKALDELTLQIRLRERFPQMIYVLAMSVYAPVAREVVDYWLATEDDGSRGRRPIPIPSRQAEIREAEQVVGTGPYVLKEFRRKSLIILERNPDFRYEQYPSEGGPGDAEAGLLDDQGKQVPFIDVIRMDFVPEDYSAWMRFLTKQTDASGIPKEVFEFVITPGKALEAKWTKRGIRLYQYESPAVYWLVFNMEDPIVGASKSLRQALSLAYDVDNHVKVLYNGRGKRAVNILPSSFKTHAVAGPGPYYRLDLDAARQKMARAKEELAAAGRLVNGEIPELKLDLPGRDRAVLRMGEFVQQQFGKLGLRLRVMPNDWPALQEKVHNKQCQIYTMGWHADYPDAENFLQLFYSPNIAKFTNNSNYSNPEFDELYDKIRTLPDTPERTAIYAKMVNMISEDCPVLLLSEPLSFVLVYEWVHNIKPHPIGYGYLKYQRLDTAVRSKMGGR